MTCCIVLKWLHYGKLLHGNPIHAWIQGGWDRWSRHPSPLKNHKTIGSLSKTDPDLLKNHKASKSTFKFWAIIGLPAKPHLRGILLGADNGPLFVLFGTSLSSQKRPKILCQSSTPSGKTFWIRSCSTL